MQHQNDLWFHSRNPIKANISLFSIIMVNNQIQATVFSHYTVKHSEGITIHALFSISVQFISLNHLSSFLGFIYQESLNFRGIFIFAVSLSFVHTPLIILANLFSLSIPVLSSATVNATTRIWLLQSHVSPIYAFFRFCFKIWVDNDLILLVILNIYIYYILPIYNIYSWRPMWISAMAVNSIWQSLSEDLLWQRQPSLEYGNKKLLICLLNSKLLCMSV